MGILRRLFPWYFWDNQWAHHLEFLGDGSGAAPIKFIADSGFRYEILSIIGTVEGHEFGAGFKVMITLNRGHRVFAISTTGLGAAANEVNRLAFQRDGLGNTRDTKFNNLGWYLPASFIMLPGDLLTIQLNVTAATDHMHDWLFSCKRWID